MHACMHVYKYVCTYIDICFKFWEWVIETICDKGCKGNYFCCVMLM